jgi:hypothetical protein
LRPRRNIVVVLAFTVLATATWGTARALDTPRPQAATACRSNPLAGVHDPTRLQILDACATFVGTVISTPKQYADGDFAFNVAPDAAFASMLNEKNRSKGGIHVEIIPMDQGVTVRPPSRNAHIRVTGAHVYDRWTGWNEIHPTWSIEVLSGGGGPPPLPPPSMVFQLTARLTGKALGKTGARDGHGRVVLTLSPGKVCWQFARLVRVGTPTRAAIRFREQGKPGRTVLPLGRRYQRRGCGTIDLRLFESLAEEARDYYVLVASKRHPYGALRGRLNLG